uniref:Uncharacterized protein n=1 Tax=Chromera velia CCMP2878 TaxID=1169474 RepID=A0A0G4GAW6_9ALVE|eukprot:Cvel_20990.t1-p1 / transcript=Cvel_20990.t1 / gene=Cvel_20990 / organism=Chromera_velia_CCMP2878 / gene_product=Cytadherence high molecular weight protein 2, putative / transcript_product=Cytadherence high molecular weight protein 2, putative / location=Cvel_scaffold1932:21534-29668(+) / protein_length=759 / sequence_SO=supercontig / SO=protein_coding / is_pseudo=false
MPKLRMILAATACAAVFTPSSSCSDCGDFPQGQDPMLEKFDKLGADESMPTPDKMAEVLGLSPAEVQSALAEAEKDEAEHPTSFLETQASYGVAPVYPAGDVIQFEHHHHIVPVDADAASIQGMTGSDGDRKRIRAHLRRAFAAQLSHWRKAKAESLLEQEIQKKIHERQRYLDELLTQVQLRHIAKKRWHETLTRKYKQYIDHLEKMTKNIEELNKAEEAHRRHLEMAQRQQKRWEAQWYKTARLKFALEQSLLSQEALKRRQQRHQSKADAAAAEQDFAIRKLKAAAEVYQHDMDGALLDKQLDATHNQEEKSLQNLEFKMNEKAYDTASDVDSFKTHLEHEILMANKTLPDGVTESPPPQTGAALVNNPVPHTDTQVAYDMRKPQQSYKSLVGGFLQLAESQTERACTAWQQPTCPPENKPEHTKLKTADGKCVKSDDSDPQEAKCVDAGCGLYKNKCADQHLYNPDDEQCYKSDDAKKGAEPECADAKPALADDKPGAKVKSCAADVGTAVTEAISSLPAVEPAKTDGDETAKKIDQARFERDAAKKATKVAELEQEKKRGEENCEILLKKATDALLASGLAGVDADEAKDHGVKLWTAMKAFDWAAKGEAADLKSTVADAEERLAAAKKLFATKKAALEKSLTGYEAQVAAMIADIKAKASGDPTAEALSSNSNAYATLVKLMAAALKQEHVQESEKIGHVREQSAALPSNLKKAIEAEAKGEAAPSPQRKGGKSLRGMRDDDDGDEYEVPDQI